MPPGLRDSDGTQMTVDYVLTWVVAPAVVTVLVCAAIISYLLR
jgi:hypothetical protein